MERLLLPAALNWIGRVRFSSLHYHRKSGQSPRPFGTTGSPCGWWSGSMCAASSSSTWC